MYIIDKKYQPIAQRKWEGGEGVGGTRNEGRGRSKREKGKRGKEGLNDGEKILHKTWSCPKRGGGAVKKYFKGGSWPKRGQTNFKQWGCDFNETGEKFRGGTFFLSQLNRFMSVLIQN